MPVIVCVFNEQENIGGMNIEKNKITAYGNMAYITKEIKKTGDYETNNYTYALENAQYWHTIIPVMMSNDKYAYFNVNKLPKDVLKMPSHELVINE